MHSPEDSWREDCAPRRVLDLFTSKWTSMVLHVLQARHGGCARTGVLHRSIPGISKKMLTETLRDMEASGLVTRRIYGTIPPAVDYSITDLGLRFLEPIEALYSWGRQNADALDLLDQHRGRKQTRRGRTMPGSEQQTSRAETSVRLPAIRNPEPGKIANG